MPDDAGANAAALATAAAAHYDLLDTEIHFANRIQVANAIAEQIWREQQLVSNRMQWNFTFQAFLAAIYVFAGSNLEGTRQLLVQLVLAAVGLVVALFCLLGVVAAQRQSTRLKKHWVNEFCKSSHKDPGECDILRGAFPQPFSKSSGSKLGRFASRGICCALMSMWAALAIITLLANLMPSRTPASGTLACNVGAPTNMAGSFSITCKPK